MVWKPGWGGQFWTYTFSEYSAHFKSQSPNQCDTAGGRLRVVESRVAAGWDNGTATLWLLARGVNSAGAPPWGGVGGKGGGCLTPVCDSYSFSEEQMEVTGASTDNDSETEMKLTKE